MKSIVLAAAASGRFRHPSSTLSLPPPKPHGDLRCVAIRSSDSAPVDGLVSSVRLPENAALSRPGGDCSLNGTEQQSAPSSSLVSQPAGYLQGYLGEIVRNVGLESREVADTSPNLTSCLSKTRRRNLNRNRPILILIFSETKITINSLRQT